MNKLTLTDFRAVVDPTTTVKKRTSTSYVLKWLLILSPFFICLFGSMACLIPYYISVYYIGWIRSSKLTFISNYSNYVPSSGFFSFFLSLAICFLFLIILFQYLAIKSIYKSNGLKNSILLKLLNISSFLMAIVFFLSALILQSFHLHTHKQTHQISSIIAVSSILLYMWLQVLMHFVFKVDISNYSTKVIWIMIAIRFLITFISTTLFILCITLQLALLQWLSVFLIFTYFLTYIPDLLQFSFKLSAKFVKNAKKYDSNENNGVGKDEDGTTNEVVFADEIEEIELQKQQQQQQQLQLPRSQHVTSSITLQINQRPQIYTTFV